MADPVPGGDWAITGAAGQIGRLLRERLRGRVDTLRLLDVKPLPPEAPGEVVHLVDNGDLSAVTEAVAGADGIIHLAGIADEAGFRELVEANIIGTYHLFEAARRSEVPRVVFASSNHVTGLYTTDDRVTPADPVRPDSLYGVSKVAGEAVARLYAEKFGLQVACLRIGSCRPRPAEPRHRNTWLSPDDAVAAFMAAMTTPGLTYAAYYAVSANDLGWWDLGPGQAVGFHPRDNAERHPHPPATTYAGNVQGGDLAEAAYTLERIAAKTT